MNIHEYQAKSLLAKYGVAVPRGAVAFTPEEAERAARDLGGPVWVVKSQIHAGGRGAGRFQDDPNGKGGVRVVKSVDEVKANAAKMLGHVLVTKQTGAAGKEVGRVNQFGNFWPFEPGLEIIFDGKVFVPPMGTEQRAVPDALGPYKLDTGDGYLLHGTNIFNEEEIGEAVSHGCVRLRNEDLEALYPQVPVGTPVFIF